MQWFTSDLHFGHARLLELSEERGAAFATAQEMDETLVTRWNDTVADDDTVWVLGDVDMHGKASSLRHVARLRGTTILVAGNHDACWGGFRDGWKHRQRYLDAGFAAVMDFASTRLPGVGPQARATRVLLSHFPYVGDSHDEDRHVEFRLRDTGTTLLHGHVHERFRESRSPLGTWGINVGVDHWGYAPVSAERLAEHLDDLATGRIQPAPPR